LLILIPVDETDLRAVVIPQAGAPHNHPTFLPTKVPFAAAKTYLECIADVGPIGATTLGVDKSSSTRARLGGKIPQEIHPALINTRARRKMLLASQVATFPEGTGLTAVWKEYEDEKTREIGDRYIHEVSTQGDMHIIITVNPDLAGMATEATWIMVDITFAVVHGKTNEWKLLIWLHGLEKRVVIGRVWSNRATREAFLRVWSGVFDAIRAITGLTLNFKVFSKNSPLLGAIGDSEGAQAQALADFIILHGLNTSTVNGIPTNDVNSSACVQFSFTYLMPINSGVYALEKYVEDVVFQILLGFPYLETAAEIEQFKTFYANSANPKVKAWWAHKISYPWLLPSLNRSLTGMPNHHWDLTPGDTNPMEGSHAQDNQVSSTNRSILEAILL
ncbi:hypothetical protein B0H13DRAFT_1593750, partial [Mycena leptocephala]